MSWSGLVVERSMIWAEGASGVHGAGRPSSPTSMPSSQLEEASDSSLSERGGGLGMRRRDWSSPGFSGEGIVVVTAVGAVGGEVGQQPERALESPPFGQVGFWQR